MPESTTKQIAVRSTGKAGAARAGRAPTNLIVSSPVAVVPAGSNRKLGSRPEGRPMNYQPRAQVASLNMGARKGAPALFNIGKSRKVTFDLTPTRRDVQILGADNLRPTKRMDPLMVLLMGRRGRGKTLGMTCLADLQRRRWEHFKLPFEIVSNYWMEPAHRVDPKLVESLNKFPDWGRNLYICLDEIGGQLANRRSLAAINVDFIQFLTQIRKRHNELITTTQFPQWIDMAVLYQIDFFCRMDIFNGNRSIEVYEWDWWGQFTGKDYRKQWPPQPQDVDHYFEIHNADLMWSAYKSDQIIPPAWAKNKDQIIAREHGEDYFEEYGLGELENAWGNEVTPGAAEMMGLAPPKTLEELLDRQQGAFDIKSLLEPAKALLKEKSLSTKQFGEHLTALGWDVEKLEGTWMASRIKG